MRQLPSICYGLLLVFFAWTALPAAENAPLRGRIVDADSGEPLPARIYIQHKDGTWFFPQSAAKEGSAVEYRKQRGQGGGSIEQHTTLSAHPFVVDLPPGEVTVTIERGKEYFSLSEVIRMDGKPREATFRLRRWINMAGDGWYSGDTHNHRSLTELPNVAAAEDVNVSLPLVYWVTQAFKSPATSEKSIQTDAPAKVIAIDKTHVIYPRNTEYEIFTVDGVRHTLGAVFLINHKSVFTEGVPPVGRVAEKAHAEGALLELDKHNWPWSMALVPIMNVDLFELSNNHIWRTDFYFKRFGETVPEYMKIDQNDDGMTERGWIDFGFQNYYALLNCGFRMRPTAGTASGVHPVPLGFGRVYVHLPEGFSYDDWMKGLDEGRSFVTTGPMLLAKVNGQQPGHTFKVQSSTPGKPATYRVTGTAIGPKPLERIEIVVAGQVARQIRPTNTKTKQGAYESRFDETIPIDGSSWIAVRCYARQPDGRWRFAHSGPVHIDVAGSPLRPRKAEAQYLVDRVQEQIERSEKVLPKAALDEYRKALRIYQEIAKTAR